MSRYIDSEAIMEIARDGYHSDFGRSMADLTSLEELIEDTPTADVVEVVRCKDCFFYQKDKELARANYLDPEKYCTLLICEIDKNGFCSYGKKNGR